LQRLPDGVTRRQRRRQDRIVDDRDTEIPCIGQHAFHPFLPCLYKQRPVLASRRPGSAAQRSSSPCAIMTTARPLPVAHAAKQCVPDPPPARCESGGLPGYPSARARIPSASSAYRAGTAGADEARRRALSQGTPTLAVAPSGLSVAISIGAMPLLTAGRNLEQRLQPSLQHEPERRHQADDLGNSFGPFDKVRSEAIRFTPCSGLMCSRLGFTCSNANSGPRWRPRRPQEWKRQRLPRSSRSSWSAFRERHQSPDERA